MLCKYCKNSVYIKTIDWCCKKYRIRCCDIKTNIHSCKYRNLAI